MAVGSGSPVLLLLTGLGWLVLAALLGLAILIGMVRGTPLPPAIRSIHAHAALVGGMLQLMIGALLAGPVHSAATRWSSVFLRFVLFNTATVGLLIGFALRDHRIIGSAGVAVAAAVLLWGKEIWHFFRHDHRDAIDRFYYGFALLALAGGLIIGIGLAFHWMGIRLGHMRLAHIHLTVLAFMTLATIGLLQRWLPVTLKRPARHPGLAVAIQLLLPAGTAGLLTGFWLTSLDIQLVAGGFFLIGMILHLYGQIKTWLEAGQPGTSASDHLLASSVFMFLTTMLGLAASLNSLWSPPLLPYGTLHIVAYTHTAFIGFLLQVVMGGFSIFLPTWLASQVPSNKKRAPYLADLIEVMNKWRAVQLFTLGCGTLGLSLLASLTWTMPLSSSMIHTIAWASAGLLAVSLALFCAKVAQLFARRPGLERTG
ncbi:MAG TPA: hypothetical protein VHF07_00095 [Nitrospiraceae bacterium]|nr:hypothetical protein [Nitrospiraceae bacterium]